MDDPFVLGATTIGRNRIPLGFIPVPLLVFDDVVNRHGGFEYYYYVSISIRYTDRCIIIMFKEVFLVSCCLMSFVVVITYQNAVSYLFLSSKMFFF